MNMKNAAPALRTDRAGRPNHPDYAVLIEVPVLRDRRHRVDRLGGGLEAGARAGTEFGAARRPAARRRTRRRLKREVKITGGFLLACLPLIYFGSHAWPGRISPPAAESSTRTAAVHGAGAWRRGGSMLKPRAARSVFEPAVVLLSIEPALAAPAPEPENPIVFPGYLLPDDSLEESGHEGG